MGASKYESAILETFRRAGTTLAAEPRRRLVTWAELLELWNRRIRLTSSTEPLLVAERHVLDSSLVAIDLAPGETLLDAGTGAGLPGIVVAVLRPDVQVTMVERIAKKVAFVRAAIEALGLPNARVVRGDLAAVASRSFDRAVSRALAAPAEWLAAGARHVRDGGAIGVMVARREELPASDAERRLEVIREIHLPSDGAARLLGWFRTSAPASRRPG